MKKIKKTQLSTLNSNIANHSAEWNDVQEYLSDFIGDILVDYITDAVNCMLKECSTYAPGYNPEYHSAFESKQITWQDLNNVLESMDSDPYGHLKSLLVTALLKNMPDNGSIKIPE